MSIELFPAWDCKQEVRELFAEYTDMLAEGDSQFREYLAIQKYDEELEHLEVKYAPPHGRLYLVSCDGQTAGCIALRRIDAQSCEMKRLYVRPAFRGQRIGELLIQRVIDDARAIGYSHMLLDTLPFLQSALHLYRRFGFYEIPSYNDSPMETSIYMKLDL
ncbi:MAG: GNAT family N-acetyltransferase [Butyrivibrio sp.]|nr:GNAT family N-acetyltransferase [Muribaculum sp.]MCM1551204.1 GNAT family N-acetyltransferase [Butyrivibrio sp.]